MAIFRLRLFIKVYVCNFKNVGHKANFQEQGIQNINCDTSIINHGAEERLMTRENARDSVLCEKKNWVPKQYT